MSFLSTWRKSLSLDYRSLALYRFLMGLVVLADVLYRWPDLMNFYTDVGLIPRATFISEMTMPWSLSFHLANGSYPFILGMFILHLIFGLMLLLGFKTRWAIIGVYVMTVSVHNRNWLVNNGGDDIMRSILFLSIFLPLNKCFSIDSALLKKDQNADREHFSTWGLAFFIQVFAIYFVSYILKDSPIWRQDFTAVFYASRLDIFATPLGVWFRNFPLFQKLISAFTIYLEWLGPLVLVGSAFLGRFWWMAMMSIVGLFWLLHLGIIATMWIGVFPYLCLAMWTIFIPGPVWDYLQGLFRKRGFGLVKIYYDGECGFCQKGVRIIREFLLLPEVSIDEGQSSRDIHQHMIKHESWVVVNPAGTKFTEFGAWIELMRHSPILCWKVPFWGLKPFFYLGNKLYRWVANHRPLMGLLTQFLEYRSPKKSSAFFSTIYQLAGAFFLITLIMWNLSTIKKWNIQAPYFQSVARWFHLYQEWNMFAPFPKMDNVWVEIPARLSDGSEIELITGDRDIYSEKAQRFYQAIPNEHWRKFYLNLSDRTDYARYYGGYLCRSWNDRHIKMVKDTTLRKMEIIVYSQNNLSDGSRGPVNRKLSWRHWCFDEDYKQDNSDNKP